MKLYPEELEAAKTRERQLAGYPALTPEQLQSIQARAVELLGRERSHRAIATLLQALPLAILCAGVAGVILGADALVSLGFPRWVTAFLAGFVHGSLANQWVTYTLHEGAGHRTIFRNGPAWLQRIGCNLARLRFGDPGHYSKHHASHHQSLGTERDGTFTQFILPRRLLRSVLPGAGALFSNDFLVHWPEKMTRSSALSLAFSLSVTGMECTLLSSRLGWALSLLALGAISPWTGFVLDRLRESYEHNLMPISRTNGTREMGLSPAGILIGGGPWGQPFHFTHHLAPSLSWYQQWALHRHCRRTLSKEQREFFGFDRDRSVSSKLLDLIRENAAILESLADNGRQDHS